MQLLIEIQCIGNFDFWVHLVKHTGVIFEQYEHYQKTGNRNRYRILGSNGPITLSIPLVGGRENRQLIREVQIDNSIRWQRDHWRTLTSCYNRSPFFEHYATFLTGFYEKHYKWLWDFDLELFHFLAKQMKLARSVSLTQNFEKVPDQAVFDLRGTLRSGKFLITDQRPYAQVFGSDFEKNLSIFDTIFNMGPETSSYLSGHLTI